MTLGQPSVPYIPPASVLIKQSNTVSEREREIECDRTRCSYTSSWEVARKKKEGVVAVYVSVSTENITLFSGLRNSIATENTIQRVTPQAEIFGLWSVRFPLVLVRTGRRLPVQALGERRVVVTLTGYPRGGAPGPG